MSTQKRPRKSWNQYELSTKRAVCDEIISYIDWRTSNYSVKAVTFIILHTEFGADVRAEIQNQNIYQNQQILSNFPPFFNQIKDQKTKVRALNFISQTYNYQEMHNLIPNLSMGSYNYAKYQYKGQQEIQVIKQNKILTHELILMILNFIERHSQPSNKFRYIKQKPYFNNLAQISSPSNLSVVSIEQSLNQNDKTDLNSLSPQQNSGEFTSQTEINPLHTPLQHHVSELSIDQERLASIMSKDDLDSDDENDDSYDETLDCEGRDYILSEEEILIDESESDECPQKQIMNDNEDEIIEINQSSYNESVMQKEKRKRTQEQEYIEEDQSPDFEIDRKRSAQVDDAFSKFIQKEGFEGETEYQSIFVDSTFVYEYEQQQEEIQIQQQQNVKKRKKRKRTKKYELVNIRTVAHTQEQLHNIFIQECKKSVAFSTFKSVIAHRTEQPKEQQDKCDYCYIYNQHKGKFEQGQLNYDQLEDLFAMSIHEQSYETQRNKYNEQINNVLKDQCIITIDFKQNITVPIRRVTPS